MPERDLGLFGALGEQQAPARALGAPRLSSPERDQVSWQPLALDDLLPADHRARQVWAFVMRVELGLLTAEVKARAGVAGRPAIDPRLLLALWLYATLQGVGSARQLARLCGEEVGYRWLCGGVSVNYHALSDARTAHAAVLERLLVDSVVALIDAGVVSLEALAQDGVRVRASAGAGSFRRARTLRRQRAEIQAHVERLRGEVAADPGGASARVTAARERAARERAERLEQALATLAALDPGAAGADATGADATGADAAGADRPDDDGGDDDVPPTGGSGPGPKATSAVKGAAATQGAAATKGAGPMGGRKRPKAPRASTTDPEARVMKMADGGFRPAWNNQIASDPASQVILAVDVTASGSDRGLMRAMIERVETSYGQPPTRWLVDGGYTCHADVEWAHGHTPRGIAVYCPPTRSKHATDPYQPRPADGPGVRKLRARMASPEGQAIYRQRPPSECIHALMRMRGLQRLLVRGREKVRAVLLWHALAHNLMRTHALT
jgi:transposase